MVGKFIPQAGMNRFDAGRARAGRAGDHDIGMVAANDPQSLADRGVTGGFVERQRIARPARVRQDADVA